jgi:hypothetical protein
MSAIGWKLDEADRAALLERFPPEWPDIVADHITLEADADDDAPLPTAERAEIVGGINDGEGLQAMVVAIDGSTDRPDGGTYHITWSLDRRRGREAIQSNDVLALRGWRPLDDPAPIRIVPAQFG